MNFKGLGRKKSGLLMPSAIAFAVSASPAFTHQGDGKKDVENPNIGRVIMQTFNQGINAIGANVLPKEVQDQIIESKNYLKTPPIAISFSAEGARCPVRSSRSPARKQERKGAFKKICFQL
ncbi:hypothetical protein [Candidatus Odyssella thessalonicensis]|uniref:hypothetical protein n=1 Tax=Candidatus Odyssella thessalonicensis TaxID=84647 RepID=UPI000225A9B6|nr:hypothetical protein [Candidatus Odyssella thessalonicensis]